MSVKTTPPGCSCWADSSASLYNIFDHRMHLLTNHNQVFQRDFLVRLQTNWNNARLICIMSRSQIDLNAGGNVIAWQSWTQIQYFFFFFYITVYWTLSRTLQEGCLYVSCTVHRSELTHLLNNCIFPKEFSSVLIWTACTEARELM